MTDPEPAESCQVSLLVPHPRRTAVLVAETTTSLETPTPRQVRLPTLEIPSGEPSLSEILASVDLLDTDAAAVLRTVMTSPGDAG